MRWTEALRHYDRAARILEEQGRHYRKPNERYYAFEVCVDAGFRSETRGRYTVGSIAAESMAALLSVVVSHVGMARASRLAGDLASASRWLDQARVRAPSLKANTEIATEACAVDAEAGAPRIVQRLKSIIRRVRDDDGPAYVELKATYTLSYCMWKHGEEEQALFHAEDAIRMADRIRYLQWVAGEMGASPRFASFVASRLPNDPAVNAITDGLERARREAQLGSRVADSPASRHSIMIRTLGRESVISNGHDLQIKPLYMEILLFIADRGEVGQETLMETFWPDAQLARQRTSMHSALYAIRKQLGRGAIVRRGALFAWGDGVFVQTDAREFERSARRALRDVNDGDGSLESAEEALEVYGGEFLPGRANEWVTDRRRELETLFLDLAVSYGNACLRQNQVSRAVPVASRAIEYDPFDERIRILSARLLAASGRRVHALHVLRDYRRLMEREMAVSPSVEVEELERLLLDGLSSSVLEDGWAKAESLQPR
jgi:two-component SAPR family response regulator